MTFVHQLLRTLRSVAGSRRRMGIVAAAMVLMLSACGQSPSIVIVLDSATAAVLRGSDVSVVVTLTRAGGASADVVLSATGLPANVTAQFSPPTLTGATLSSTLTITAEAAAVAGSYDVIVTGTGTGTGLADSADLTLEVTSLSVTGRVVSIIESPAAGVFVGSQGENDITDADGYFTLTGLAVPYDLAVWSQADTWVQIYEGLTSTDLLLAPMTPVAPSGTPRSTTISGNLAGGVIPVAANQVVMVCIEGLDGTALGCDRVTPGQSDYSFPVQWYGPTTRSVRVHALQVQHDMPGYPTAYLGYTATATTLTDTVPAAVNLTMGGALSTTTVDVDIDATDPLAATIAAVELGPYLAMPVSQVSSAATTHQFMMPVIDDASYTFLSAVDIDQFGWHADVTSTMATVPVPALPQLITPADMSTGVTTSTTFSAVIAIDGPNTFTWTENLSGLVVSLTTMSSSTTIPDLAPYGLALPAGSDFRWQVVSQSGDRVEDATRTLTDYYGLLLLLSQAATGYDGVGSSSFSATREFTTAP